VIDVAKAVIGTTESGWFGFLKTSDVYDSDRVEADRELIRRFYAKNGFADARVTSAVGAYDSAQQGIVLSFTLDEGERYRMGAVEVESHIPALDAAALRFIGCHEAHRLAAEDDGAAMPGIPNLPDDSAHECDTDLFGQIVTYNYRIRQARHRFAGETGTDDEGPPDSRSIGGGRLVLGRVGCCIGPKRRSMRGPRF